MLTTRVIAGLLLLLSSCSTPGSKLQRLLNSATTGTLQLPPGLIPLDKELRLPDGAHDLEIVGGAGTVLRATSAFNGKALLVIRNARNIGLRNFLVDGNRIELVRISDIPLAAEQFAEAFQSNGILVVSSTNILISNVNFRDIPSFAVLASKTKGITIEKAAIQESGSLNRNGRNNTTGGILLEEGTDNFIVRDCVLRKIFGNGIWTHSTFRSPRNRTGLITGNRFENIGRDAIQVGHANKVRVENNTGRFIGYPQKIVDVENGGIPVGIDTAGNVDNSVYAQNQFEDINGKCIDLDGFHHGEVSGNVCINRGAALEYPQGHFALVMNNTNREMKSASITIRNNVFDGTKYGGIFVIGSNHRITGNKLLNINKAGCNESAAKFGCAAFPGEPDLMQSGIYLGLRAELPAPAHDNLIENNEISGYRMSQRCVLAAQSPLVVNNTIRSNRCTDTP
ncbi:MAG: right-handed parallel beta-helix repeat-containing protein [Acidobacteriia bacterium]|nr:right-handed parallel beta-helix repeat-containing protein [Terriglobia bacterium]